jgi:hypothetical protein
MLERVALHQTRFHTPGLACDPRGVAIGQKLALLFTSLDRLVGFLRIYSEQASLDDLLPSLQILRVRTPLAAHELLLTFAAESSYRADRAARIARLLSGLCFTGSARHFVQYRDESSPLGYDTPQVSSDEGDFVLYGEAFTQAYQRADEIAFAQLVFRLQLIREAGRPDIEGAEFLYVVARQGLGRALLRYLWRSRLGCAAAHCEPPAGGIFAGESARWIVRVSGLPDRMLRLFASTPGLSIYRPLGANVAVEIGYHHPIHLESCSQIFARDRFYLFAGAAEAVELLAGPLEFVSSDAFVQPSWDLGRDPVTELPAVPRRPESIEVPIRLAPSSGQPRRVTAALIPTAQVGWLKKLTYTLPPTLLRGHRIATAGDHLIVVAEARLDVIPLGMPMQELATGLYVPVGWELVPRTSPEVLAQHVGAGSDRLVFFAPFLAAPLALDAGVLLPLERRALAQVALENIRAARRPPTAGPVEPEIVSAPVGRFALWGFQGEKPER